MNFQHTAALKPDWMTTNPTAPYSNTVEWYPSENVYGEQAYPPTWTWYYPVIVYGEQAYPPTWTWYYPVIVSPARPIKLTEV